MRARDVFILFVAVLCAVTFIAALVRWSDENRSNARRNCGEGFAVSLYEADADYVCVNGWRP